ncbi:glycosyltransferase family 2 protein [Halomicronema hongdechloris]|nr:glycosyltransferase [Halomicronema hongdechloris]
MEFKPLEFSIIIPTYNRPDRLRQCLQSLTQLDYPRTCFEVIVVDDGSPQPLTPVIKQFESTLSLQLMRQRNAGPASARNTGATAAQGAYLVFTDDDCQPQPNWLMALAAAIAKVPGALIGGHTLNALPHNPYSTASQLLIDYLYDYYNQAQGEATFFASNNFAVPRDQYQTLGGFDTSFPLAAGEDREFCDRWRHHGFPMCYAPEVETHHAHTLTLASFWRQHFNYGRGAFYFHHIRSQRQADAMGVEPLSFYTRLLTYPLSRELSWRAGLIAGLLFLSQVANVAGFFWERRHQQASPPAATAASS